MQDSKEKITKPQNNPETEKRSSNKKILRWIEIFCFLLLFDLSLHFLSYLKDPVRLNDPKIMLPRDRNVYDPLNEPENSIDVAIVGDSEAWAMINPDMMMEDAGISAYNCNQRGQRMIENYFFLVKFFKKQSPKVVVLETNVITHDTTFNTEAHLSFNAMITEQFPIIRFHSNWRYLIGVGDASDYVASRGYEEIITVDPYTGGDYMIETDEREKINPITIHYLNKVRELCEENGATLVLATSPSPINMTYPKHNTIQDYADKYNIDYIDFNLLTDEIGLDWSNDTGDQGDHINMYGAPKTTKYLMDYLEENFDLPDHRED